MMKNFAFLGRDYKVEYNQLLRLQSVLALENLQSVRPDDLSGIHEARKGFKRLRACFYLLKPTDKSAFRWGNRLFRDVSAQLSVLRDNQVLRETLDRLSAAGELSINEPGVISLYERLALREKKSADFIPEIIVGAKESVEKFIRQLDISNPIPFGRQVFYSGIQMTYKECRRGWKKALGTNSDELFHQWRKKTKYHYFHMQLSRSICQCSDKRMERLDLLCELLGRHHDLMLLKTLLDQHERNDAATLRVLIREQAVLAEQSRLLGKKVFALPVGDYSLRLERLVN